MKCSQKKLDSRRREVNRIKLRLKLLTYYLVKERETIAKACEENMDEKCSEFKVPNKQKLAMRDIVAAAKANDSKGRRYSEQWITPCTLMNIRSSSCYEFLKKDEILPLLCLKTVRDYFSLMACGYGLDEGFIEILGKNFKTKDVFKQDGIICADGINSKRSIAVSPRNSTYQEVTEFSDSKTVGDISADNLATYGLVIMFQSLTENYFKLISTFASKKSCCGGRIRKSNAESYTRAGKGRCSHTQANRG